jgi:hypothetical protein
LVVTEVTATYNGLGIVIIVGATRNKVVNNTALHNGIDLDDANPGCDKNKWKVNLFETASQACIA